MLRRRAAERPTDFLRDIHSRGLDGAVAPEELERAFARLDKLLDRMDALLGENGPWIVGDFSLADIAVAPYMFRLSALGEARFWSKDKRPRVANWYARVGAREAFRAAVSWPDEGGGGYEEVGLGSTLPAGEAAAHPAPGPVEKA